MTSRTSIRVLWLSFARGTRVGGRPRLQTICKQELGAVSDWAWRKSSPNVLAI